MIDCIWFAIYLGMATGVIAVALVVYGTYIDLRNKNDRQGN